MNKTIYLPDEESGTWEKARRLANDRLSPLILQGLKEFIVKREAEAAGHQRIQLEFDDSDDNEVPKIKAFHGKWIFSPKAPLRTPDLGRKESDCYCVAVTAKGNVVVFTWKAFLVTEGQDTGEELESQHRFLVFPSFEEAARDREVNYAIREAIRKRGVPIEELDI